MRASLTVFLITTLIGTATFAHQDIDQPPPAAIYEVSPGERPGYVLAPGYWRWDGKRHIWSPSRWIAERPGHSWVPDSWEQHGSKWHFAKGYWADAATGEAESNDEVADEPVPEARPAKRMVSKAKARKPAPVVKRKKAPDYYNQNVWPRVIHH